MKIKNLIKSIMKDGPITQDDSIFIEYLRTRDPEMYAWAPMFAVLVDPDNFPCLVNESYEIP